MMSVGEIVPRLDGSLAKGDSGRLLVVGGSLEYTGAPYFTAISALRSVAIMSFIFAYP
jgi:ATP-dependent NAD(P)H-hydrate dehydratase